MEEQPIKKSDKELWFLLAECIIEKDYVFLRHANQRLKERNINQLDVLNILEHKKKYKSKRNEAKDKYDPSYNDWNYCVEGRNLDNDKIRIIFSFQRNLLLLITVMWIN